MRYQDHIIKASRAHRRRVILPEEDAGPAWMTAGGAPTPLAAYQPIAAASYAASLLDLSGNAKHAYEGTTPNWDPVNGWQGNGSNMYLKTGITNAQRAWTIVARFSNMTASTTGSQFGAIAGAAELNYYRYFSTYYYLNGPYIAGSAPNGGAGVIAIANATGYLDGVSDATIAAGTPPTTELYLLARNQAGVPNNFCTGYLQAWAAWNSTLTPAQILAISTELAAL